MAHMGLHFDLGPLCSPAAFEVGFSSWGIALRFLLAGLQRLRQSLAARVPDAVVAEVQRLQGAVPGEDA